MSRMRHGGPRSLALFGLLSLAACSSRESGPREFDAARTYEPVGRNVRWDASSAERFGMSSKDFAMGSGAPAGPAAASYALPAGWSELPTSQFREANFRVAGNPQAECYLSTLAGEGGGLAANVNRWRAQMSLPPLGGDEIAMLPRVDWLGKKAVSVDFTGTWTGMSGDNNAAGWRLVGLLLVEPTQSRFLKMTGPGEVLERELENFRALAASLRLGAAAQDDGSMDMTGELPPGHPPMNGGASANAGSGASGMESSTASAPAAIPAGNRSPGGYEWTPPAGWTRGPEKAMREITYVVGEAECYVTLLGGTGGGMLANINRWCGQMGQAPFTEADVAKFARVPMLGADATIVELERGSSSSTAAEYLLGAVCLLPERSVFVKMTGPRTLLERELVAFQDFCKSARVAE